MNKRRFGIIIAVICLTFLLTACAQADASTASVYGYTYIGSSRWVNNVIGNVVYVKPSPSIEKTANTVGAIALRIIRNRKALTNRGTSRSFWPIIEKVGSQYWPNSEQLIALHWIQRHECNTPGKVNAYGCVGLGQLKNPPKWMVRGNAESEIKAMCEYIKRRYGTPLKAKSFWLHHNWY